MVVSLEGGRVEARESIGFGADADPDGRGGNAGRREGEALFFPVSDLLPPRVNIPRRFRLSSRPIPRLEG